MVPPQMCCKPLTRPFPLRFHSFMKKIVKKLHKIFCLSKHHSPPSYISDLICARIHDVILCNVSVSRSLEFQQKKTKRSMGHIAHLRKQFKSFNTYGYIIILINIYLHRNITLIELNGSLFEQT